MNANVIFCLLVTIWCAYENVYEPPPTHAGLMIIRATGCINGVAAIMGCLLQMMTKKEK